MYNTISHWQNGVAQRAIAFGKLLLELGMRISVIGSGYVGLVTAVCFAELGHDVTLYDNDPTKQDVLRQGKSPIHELYVSELLKRHLGTKLVLSDALPESVDQSEAIFVAVGTPPTENGEAD